MTLHRSLTALAGAFCLAACATAPTAQFQALPITESELLSDKWQHLERYSPLFPIEEARAGSEGCASVEYVVTPDYEIKEIKVAGSTSHHFATQAKRVISQWKWADLPKGILEAPVKTRTQFLFCLETGDGHCSQAPVLDLAQCGGDDIILSVAQKALRRG